MHVSAASGNENVMDGPVELEETNVTQVVITRDDDNDEGTLICSIGDFVKAYCVTGSLIIRDDENDEGTLICSICVQDYISLKYLNYTMCLIYTAMLSLYLL